MNVSFISEANVNPVYKKSERVCEPTITLWGSKTSFIMNWARKIINELVRRMRKINTIKIL